MHSTLENDMVCLVDSLQCLKDDDRQQVQALEHLSEMCLQDNGAELFVKTNGMTYVEKLLLSSRTHESILQKCLLALGNATIVNLENKQYLCTDEVFGKVRSLLIHKEKNKSIASASYFLACICTNYQKAQVKARMSKCLENLVSLYRKFHPKGESDSAENEEWFEKADSTSSPIMINHVSHALKAMINKPQNVENQLACSRLLNLSISTLSAKSVGNQAIIEALQFIGNTVFDNEKTKRIFCMVGGIRYLAHCFEVELSKVDGKAIKDEILLVAWDTLAIAVSNNSNAKSLAAKAGIIKSLVECLRRNLSDSALLKCLICISDLVHESECLQQKLLECDGVAVVIQIMSKTQDDMISKVGTTILQSCVLTLHGKDTTANENHEEDQDFSLSSLLKFFTSKVQKPQRKKKTNSIKDIFSSLNIDPLDTEVATKMKELINHMENGTVNENGMVKENGTEKKSEKISLDERGACNTEDSTNEMILLLKEQKKLMKDFQKDVTVLRSEIRSHKSSECGESLPPRNMVSSSPVSMRSKRSLVCAKSQFYPVSLPGRVDNLPPHPPSHAATTSLNGIKHSKVQNPIPTYSNFQEAPLSKEAIENIQNHQKATQSRNSQRDFPVPQKIMDERNVAPSSKEAIENIQKHQKATQSRNSQRAFPVHQKIMDERNVASISADEKRPGPAYSVTSSEEAYRNDGNVETSLYQRHLSPVIAPSDLKEASVIEKVELWRRSNEPENEQQVPEHVFQVPFVTAEMKRKHSSNLIHGSPSANINLDNTPIDVVLDEKYAKSLQNAPKKRLPTKRRRPPTPDEGYADTTPDVVYVEWEGTKRTLNFEGIAVDRRVRNDNGHANTQNAYHHNHIANMNKEASFVTLSDRFSIKENETEQYVISNNQSNKNKYVPSKDCLGCYLSVGCHKFCDSRIIPKLLASAHSCLFHYQFSIRYTEWMKSDTNNSLDSTKKDENIKKHIQYEKETSLLDNMVEIGKFTSPVRKLKNSPIIRSKKYKGFFPQKFATLSEHQQYDAGADMCSERSFTISEFSSNGSQLRRHRQDYSDEEIQYILEGVARFGTNWTTILKFYPFKKSRLAVDLGWKYKHLKKANKSLKRKVNVPFTHEELQSMKRTCSKSKKNAREPKNSSQE